MVPLSRFFSKKKKKNDQNNHSFSFVVTCCHSLYHSLLLAVPLVVIRCHSLSLVSDVISDTSLDVSRVYSFINNLLFMAHFN